MLNKYTPQKKAFLLINIKAHEIENAENEFFFGDKTQW